MKKYLTLIVAFLVFFSISFVPNSSVKANVIDTNSEIFTVTKEVSYDDLSPSDQKDLGPPH